MHTAVYTLVTAVFILVVIAGDAYRRLHTGNRGIYFIGYPTEKNFLKTAGVLQEHSDVAWTTEINRGRPWFNETRLEKTAVFIVAVIADYM